MALPLLVARVSFCAVIAAASTIAASRYAWAQEEFFKPAIEAPPTKTPVGGQQVYSFSRLDPDFTALCVELELAGRRERVVKVAELGIDREKECISCRAFWKMVVSACGRLGPKPTRVPKKPLKEERSSAMSGDASSSGAATEGTIASKSDAGGKQHVKKPREERYPTVAVIDLASRMSAALYESDKGDGPTAHMLHYFAKTMLATPDLSGAEREYFDIMFTYLLASWAGRVDTTKLPTPTPSSELRDLFDFN